MTREDVIRMAREAGFDPHDMSDDFTCNLRDLERFAALVAAAERKACAEHYLKIMRDAVAKETEACAQVCENLSDEFHAHAMDCAATIRARANAERSET